MTMHGVRAQQQLLGDFLIVQPLAISASTSRSRLDSSTAAGSPATRAGASGASTERKRPRHRRHVPGPREVSAPVERDQHRPGYQRREFPADPVRDRAVAAAVHDQRRCPYPVPTRPDITR